MDWLTVSQKLLVEAFMESYHELRREQEIKKECAKELMNDSIIFGNSEVAKAHRYLIENGVDVDSYIEKGVEEMKRINLKHNATAMVSKDCPKSTIDALNRLVYLTFIKGIKD